ncbi:MAG: isoprenylcysteine carboxylmethyltransferase family protein [Bacteroidales bacterium]|nr:MAG: isoprenylcysteine carboxylmethyltransferase family protein [Bacteroidales bacterium]
MKYFGITTINPIVFYIGKLAFVGNMIFIFFGGYVKVYKFNSIILLADLVLLFIPGLLILFTSIFQLGESIRVGLPEEDTSLKTHGFFRISRNPIYLSVYMLSLASCIYVPHWLNIIFLLLTIMVHHQIVIAEEKFLKGKFNEQWAEYCQKVRRYL